MATVFLSLGSNIGKREVHLQTALEKIALIGDIIRISPVYETESLGFEGDVFYNLCAEIETLLSAEDLIKKLLDIEDEMGRKRTTLNGDYQDRIIDVDILFYDYKCVDSPTITIPHPRLTSRRFVLEPLLSIAPDYKHPKFNLAIKDLLNQCFDTSTILPLSKKLSYHYTCAYRNIE